MVDKTCFVADKTYSCCKKAAVKVAKRRTEWADLIAAAQNWETSVVKLVLGMYSSLVLASEKGRCFELGALVLRLRTTEASILLEGREACQTMEVGFASSQTRRVLLVHVRG